MKAGIIVHTSVDDLRSSLYHINPENHEEKKKVISWLWDNVIYEKDNQNRSSIIKMLVAKIKRLEKLI